MNICSEVDPREIPDECDGKGSGGGFQVAQEYNVCYKLGGSKANYSLIDADDPTRGLSLTYSGGDACGSGVYDRNSWAETPASAAKLRELDAAGRGDASGGVWKAWTPRHARGGLASAAGGGGGGTTAARENPASVPGRRVAASRRRPPAPGAGVPARSRPGRTPAPSSSPANAVSANRSSPPP